MPEMPKSINNAGMILLCAVTGAGFVVLVLVAWQVWRQLNN